MLSNQECFEEGSLNSSEPPSPEVKKEIEKGVNLLCRFISFQSRSTQECLEKLKKNQFPSHLIPAVLSKMKDHDLINDERLINEMIDSQMNSIGSERIFNKLIKKGIQSSLIKEILETKIQVLDQDKLGLTLIEAKQHLFLNDPLHKQKEKIYRLLRQKGFPSEKAQRILKKYLSSLEH